MYLTLLVRITRHCKEVQFTISMEDVTMHNVSMEKVCSHNDAERCHEDADREGDTDPADGDNTLLTGGEEEGEEENHPENADVEDQEDCRREDHALPGSVGEVHADVDCLDDAARRVDSDEEDLVGLDHGVVDPQHRAEQRHHVRH